MNRTVRDPLVAPQPQMLRAELRPDTKELRKPLADLRPVIGHLVGRAFELMGVTKQDAAWQMQYRDQGTVSRWCSGLERPLFDKLFTLEGFEVAWVLAMAERNTRIEVATVVTIRRVG